MNRSTAHVALLCAVSCLICGCKSKHELDGGVDGSFPQDFIDGGLLAVGGCVSPDGEKFMVRLQHATPEGILTCALVSFRKDAGAGLYDLIPPSGFQIDDARYSNTCDFENSDGQLTQNYSARVSRLWGEIRFELVWQGKPRSFFIDGGAVLGSRIFGFANDFAGSSSICAGN